MVGQRSGDVMVHVGLQIVGAVYDSAMENSGSVY